MGLRSVCAEFGGQRAGGGRGAGAKGRPPIWEGPSPALLPSDAPNQPEPQPCTPPGPGVPGSVRYFVTQAPAARLGPVRPGISSRAAGRTLIGRSLATGDVAPAAGHAGQQDAQVRRRDGGGEGVRGEGHVRIAPAARHGRSQRQRSEVWGCLLPQLRREAPWFWRPKEAGVDGPTHQGSAEGDGECAVIALGERVPPRA